MIVEFVQNIIEFTISSCISFGELIQVEGHLNPGPFIPRLFNHELSNPGLFNHEFLNHGVEKFMVEKSGVEKSGVEMSSLYMVNYNPGFFKAWG